MVIYVLTSNAEEAEVEWLYESLQELLELTPQKDVLFVMGDWNTEVGNQESQSKILTNNLSCTLISSARHHLSSKPQS